MDSRKPLVKTRDSVSLTECDIIDFEAFTAADLRTLERNIISTGRQLNSLLKLVKQVRAKQIAGYGDYER